MGNDQSKKKGKRILEEKKKQIANLTEKKEKMDRIHSTVNQDVNQINNANLFQHQQSQNFSHYHNQPFSNNEYADDNILNRNKSFNPHLNNENQMDLDGEFNYANQKRNHSANRTEFINSGAKNNQNNFISDINNANNPSLSNLQNINYANNSVSKSVFVPNNGNSNINVNPSINLNNFNNANNQNYKNNQVIAASRNDNIPNNSGIDSKSEKLIKDLDIIEKLVEKYKIVYLDSYYYKRDKNYNDAIDRNLQGQEYVEKLLKILKQKKEKEYSKYLNICINLQNQFATLMQEIQSEMVSQGKNPDALVNQLQSLKAQNRISNYNIDKNDNLNNNQNLSPNSLHHHKSNVPNDILDRIKSEILDKDPKVKFDEVVGLDNVKQALKEIIIIPSLRPDLFTGLRTPAKGLLLFGPPGTGKTLIAKAVATECKSVFFNISASSLTSKYVGESEKLVKALFEVARYPENQPAIIFIDEIESILSKRSENDNEVSKRLKTEFLVQFDGVATNAADRILVIGATNRPQDLDPAVLRRLPKKIFVGPMDFNGRANFIFEVLNKTKTENTLKDKDLARIAEITDNYSNSDLKELCRQACIEPIRELKEGQLEKIEKLRPINLQDFEKAVKAVRGTLTPDMLGEYMKWNKENGALN